MEILQSEMSFESKMEGERIFVRICEPAEKSAVKAVLQIVHGMAEHSLLYVDFASFLASHGYAVAINDHLGHGKSVSSGGSYGYFGPLGMEAVLEDMHKLYSFMREKYPDVPYFMMGHSMGSFLCREYTARWGTDLSGAIYMGTCGPQNPALLVGELRVAEHYVKKLGPRSHHPIFAKLSTERFNKSFAPNRTSADWVTRDEIEVDKYVADPLCGFDFTTSAYRELIWLQKTISQESWLERVPKPLPILLISGDKDPLGDCGKGIIKLKQRLERTGHTVRMILYPGARHALITETNKDEIYADIKDFLESLVIPLHE